MCETYWCNQTIILFKMQLLHPSSASLRTLRFRVNTNIIIDNKILFLWFYSFKSDFSELSLAPLGVATTSSLTDFKIRLWINYHKFEIKKHCESRQQKLANTHMCGNSSSRVWSSQKRHKMCGWLLERNNETSTFWVSILLILCVPEREEKTLGLTKFFVLVGPELLPEMCYGA